MATPIESRRETTIRDFLNVVFKRKAMILTIVLVVTVVVVYLNASQPTVFQSWSRVLIKRGEVSNVFTGAMRYLPWEEDVSSLLELILSEPVFAKARTFLADSSVVWGADDAGRFRGGNARADVIGESNVFRIGYTDHDPVFAQRACDAVTRSFEEYFKERTAPPPLSDFFAGEIQDIKTDLDYWRERRKEFLNKGMFFGATDEGRFLLQKLNNLEMQLSKVKDDLSAQQSNVNNLRMLVALSPDELETRLSFSGANSFLLSGIISNLKLNLQNLRLKQETLLSSYTPKHPDVIAVTNQIAELQATLKKEVGNFYNLESARLVELMRQKENLESQIHATNEDINAIPDKDSELQTIESKISLLSSKYEMLVRKQDEAEIAMASQPEWDVTVLSAAGRAYPQKTKDYIRIALGPFFSFIIALGLAFFFESLDHSLGNVAEVEEYLKVPVLATISDRREEK
jgi:succinoglycan biosynthesis transport protein ExoP